MYYNTDRRTPSMFKPIFFLILELVLFLEVSYVVYAISGIYSLAVITFMVAVRYGSAFERAGNKITRVKYMRMISRYSRA